MKFATQFRLDPLERRVLMDAVLTNVLVNDPTLDKTAQDTQSETAIVLGAGNKVIVAYNDSAGWVAGDKAGFTGYSRSTDGGESFVDKGGLPPNPYHDLSDPVLARSEKTGTIFLSDLGIQDVYSNPTPPPPLATFGQEQVNVFRSTNNGATFDKPVNATPGFDADVDYQDKPWIAVDNFPGEGYGNAYLVTRHYRETPTGFKFDLLLTRSTDDGLTWGPSGGTVIVPPGGNTFQGPNVVVGSDHAVYVFWWNCNDSNSNWSSNQQIVMRKSIDQGVTFGDPVTVTAVRGYLYGGDLYLTDSGGHSFQTNSFPQAAVNPITGDIYMTYADWGNGSGSLPKDKGNIYFTQSSDGGEKWTKPVQINDDATTNDQWFPAVAVTPDGSHVGLFWYDRRLDPANNLIDRYGAIGDVSGHKVSFGANFRITDASFPPVFTYWTGSGWHTQDPVVRPGYMSDYDQATADNGYFYTTWSDNRLANALHANQPDVFMAKVPVDWQAPGVAAPVAGSAATAGYAASGSLFSTQASWSASAVSAPFMTALQAGAKKTTIDQVLDLMSGDLLGIV